MFRSVRSGSYEIETFADDIERGTAIRCYLRDDCADFSKEETVKRRSSSFDEISVERFSSSQKS